MSNYNSDNTAPILAGDIEVYQQVCRALSQNSNAYRNAWVCHVDRGNEFGSGHAYIQVGLSNSRPDSTDYTNPKTNSNQADYCIKLNLGDIDMLYRAAGRRDGGIAGLWGVEVGVVVDPADNYTIIAICPPKR